jgi:hypothetical protein
MVALAHDREMKEGEAGWGAKERRSSPDYF